MRRTAIAAVSLLIIMTLAGCSGNLFMEWDKPEVPSVDEINDKNVEDQSGADNFLSDVDDWYDSDMLSGDKDTSDAVVGKLEDIYDDDSLDDATQQEAASLAGKISIQSDPNAEELSTNIIGSYDELSSADSTTAEELLQSIIPQEAMEDIYVFTEMVNTLVQSADAYIALGESIGPSPSETIYLSDAELGDAAQLGTVAVAIAASIDSFDGLLDGNYANEDYDNLYSIAKGDKTYSEYPTAADPMTAFEDNDPNILDTYDGIVYLLEAAGLSFS